MTPSTFHASNPLWRHTAHSGFNPTPVSSSYQVVLLRAASGSSPSNVYPSFRLPFVASYAFSPEAVPFGVDIYTESMGIRESAAPSPVVVGETSLESLAMG